MDEGAYTDDSSPCSCGCFFGFLALLGVLIVIALLYRQEYPEAVSLAIGVLLGSVAGLFVGVATRP